MSVEQHFKELREEQRREFCYEVVHELSDILSTDFSGKTYSLTDFDSFIDSLSTAMIEITDKATYRINAHKTLNHLVLIHGVKEDDEYQALAKSLDQIECKESYYALRNSAILLGNRVVKSRFSELEKIIQRLRNDDATIFDEIVISPMNVMDYLPRKHNPRSNMPVQVEQAFGVLKGIFVSYALEKKVDFERDLIRGFLRRNYLNRNSYDKLKKGNFDYKEILEEDVPFIETFSLIIGDQIKAKRLISDISSSLAGLQTDNLVIEYTKRTRELDGILNELTRNFCAASCRSPPEGCCNSHHYGKGVPKEFILLQEAEAIKNDWEGEGRFCKYHNPDGCKLTLYKSPICVGFLCGDVQEYLTSQLNTKDAREFEWSMTEICRQFSYVLTDVVIQESDIKAKDRGKAYLLLSAMDAAIKTGRRLVEAKRSREYLQIEDAG